MSYTPHMVYNQAKLNNIYMYDCMYVCMYVCMYIKIGQQNTPAKRKNFDNFLSFS